MKKISEIEFARIVINKEMEMVGGPTFETIEDMSAWQKEHPQWFQEYSFDTAEDFFAWRDYFYSIFYECFPKKYSRSYMERYFDQFDLYYGLSVNE